MLQPLFRRPLVHLPDQGGADAAPGMLGMYGDLFDVGPIGLGVDEDVPDRFACRVGRNPRRPGGYIRAQLFHSGRWVIGDRIHAECPEKFPCGCLNLLDAP